jgi:uncharacterized protein (TIGR02996 family)
VIAELFAHVVADPDDRDAFLVLGDALQAAGDPRGELVIVQTQLAANPTPELRAREAELIARHRAAWLGELATLGWRDLEVTWRCGFVDHVRFGPPRYRDDIAELDFDDLIGRLARMPSNELVRGVEVGAVPPGPISWRRGIEAIARHGLPPNTRCLELHGSQPDFYEHQLASLAPAYGRLARLRELVIGVNGLALGELELPELRELEHATPGLTVANAKAISGASWPALECLTLAIGEPGERGCDLEPGSAVAMLGELRTPKLRHVGLRSAANTDELVAALVRLPLIGQLESLDLAYGTLGDAGAAHLLACTHLRALDLTHAFLGERMRDALVAAFGARVVLDAPQSPDDDFRRPRGLDHA